MDHVDQQIRAGGAHINLRQAITSQQVVYHRTLLHIFTKNLLKSEIPKAKAFYLYLSKAPEP